MAKIDIIYKSRIWKIRTWACADYFRWRLKKKLMKIEKLTAQMNDNDESAIYKKPNIELMD